MTRTVKEAYLQGFGRGVKEASVSWEALKGLGKGLGLATAAAAGAHGVLYLDNAIRSKYTSEEDIRNLVDKVDKDKRINQLVIADSPLVSAIYTPMNSDIIKEVTTKYPDEKERLAETLSKKFIIPTSLTNVIESDLTKKQVSDNRQVLAVVPRSVAVTAHELGHVLDYDNLQRTALTMTDLLKNPSLSGLGKAYATVLGNEARANINALKILNEHQGTLSAISAVPTLASSFISYTAPVLLPLGAGIGAALGVAKALKGK